MSSSPAPARSRNRLVWILGGALVIAVALLIASLVRPGQDTAAPNPSATPSEFTGTTEPAEQPRMPDLARRTANDATALGKADAPVVLIEYADYRCPFCGVFDRDTKPQIVRDYVDKGLVRIEWRDAPIFGDESINAAVAARAAGRQGKFWEYHTAIYAYEGRDHQALPQARLVEIAKQVGVPDIAAFTTALADADLRAEVMKDSQEAKQLGVQSTPTFLVGGSAVIGAQPFDAFQTAIDKELKLAGR